MRRSRATAQISNEGANVPEEDLKKIVARRGKAIVALLAVGVAGVAWVGCGSDGDESSSKLEQSINEGVDEAQQELEKGVDEAQESLEGTDGKTKKQIEKSQKDIEEGFEKGKAEAEKGLERGKAEAEKGIEEAEKDTYTP